MKSTKIVESDKESYLFDSTYENKILKLYLSNGSNLYFYSEKFENEGKTKEGNLISNEIILKSFFEFSEIFVFPIFQHF